MYLSSQNKNCGHCDSISSYNACNSFMDKQLVYRSTERQGKETSIVSCKTSRPEYRAEYLKTV